MKQKPTYINRESDQWLRSFGIGHLGEKVVSVCKEYLGLLMEYTEDETFDLFAQLPGAIVHNDFVYVPGKRSVEDGRVLLVAHCDKAYDNPCSVLWDNDGVAYLDQTGLPAVEPVSYKINGKTSYYKRQPFACLGADDRVGCAMMYLLKDTGHSILITRGEESGGIGASAASDCGYIAEDLQAHSFMVQVDRRGSGEFVTYGLETPEFLEFMYSKFPDFTDEIGSYSDIATIGPAIGLCGVNLAAGFTNEHTASERFYLGAWQLTYHYLNELLCEEKLPKFLLPEDYSDWGYGWSGYDRATGWQDSWDSWDEAGCSKSKKDEPKNTEKALTWGEDWCDQCGSGEVEYLVSEAEYLVGGGWMVLCEDCHREHVACGGDRGYRPGSGTEGQNYEECALCGWAFPAGQVLTAYDEPVCRSCYQDLYGYSDLPQSHWTPSTRSLASG